MASETERLATFVSETAFEEIPTSVVDHAKTMIVDTIGVMLVGADTDTVRIAGEKSEAAYGDASASGARVLGTSWTFPPEQAAFLNGISAHALDFDDVHKTMGGHPSAPILPPLLSVGEEIGADGEALLRSFVVGVETELVLAAILNPSHYDRGWHPTAIFGHMGAAAAVGSLLELETEEIQRALGIATSQASGVKGNFGTMTKPYHVGKAARSGIEAARLVGSGFTAATDLLERDFGGYCDLYKGEDGYDFDDHIGDLGDVWRLTDPPVNFKEYPCCGSTHVPIDVVRGMREELDVTFDDINAVRITEHPRRLAHTNDPRPTTELEGKFSVQYVVAKTLRDGTVWLDDFADERVNEPEIQEFLRNVEVNPDESVPDEQDRYARIDIEANGETYSHELETRRLRGKEEVHEKFRKCVASSPLNGDGEALVATLESLEDVTDLREVVDDLSH